MIEFIETYWLLLVNLLASGLLFAHCMWRINVMGRRSHHGVRFFYVLLAVGAAGVLLGPIYYYTNPQPAEVISNIGAAGLLWGGWFAGRRRADDVMERKP